MSKTESYHVGAAEHFAAEAERRLRSADAIANADHWSGDRGSALQARHEAAIALGILALVEELAAIREELAAVSKAVYDTGPV